MGWGQITPRFGLAYRLTERTVVRGGFGMTTDPDSLRFLRDSFPVDQAPTFSNASGNGTVALNTTTGTLLPLNIGIPNPNPPNLSTGFVSLPVSGGTTTVVQNYRRGYIESWNLFFQQDIGANFVANVGYVGTHQVRQLAPLDERARAQDDLDLRGLTGGKDIRRAGDELRIAQRERQLFWESIPTVMVFDKGEVQKKLIGAQPRRRLEDELSSWLA